MTQEEINAMLAAALDDAQFRLEMQDACIGMLLDEIEEMSYRMDEVLEEGRNARLYYADQRKKLGLTIDLSGGSLI